MHKLFSNSSLGKKGKRIRTSSIKCPGTPIASIRKARRTGRDMSTEKSSITMEGIEYFQESRLRMEFAYHVCKNTERYESQLRDVDFSKETIQHFRAKLIKHVGHAILAQANSDARHILQFIQ